MYVADSRTFANLKQMFVKAKVTEVKCDFAS